MTEPTIVALAVAFLGAIPPTVVALAAYMQGRKNGAKTEEVAVKADAIVKKADEIHVLADGNLSEIKSQLLVARQEIDGLKKLVDALTQKQGIPGVVGDQGAQGAQGDKGDKGDKGGLFK